MKDVTNRAIMAELYRVLEKYEEPEPSAFVYQEDAQAYFYALVDDLRRIWVNYKNSPVANELGIAMFNALQEKYQQKMTRELVFKETSNGNH